MALKENPPIRLLGVKQNNLKNVNLDIPLGSLTVITGVSGSGKSSLAFDTLYAEGSRRYMESLSTYARQFLEKMPRPDVDAIHNVPPAIALEQRNSIANNRTTLATMTEIYDYLRLLFASAGHQSCSSCGHDEVKYHDSESIAARIAFLEKGAKMYLLAKVPEPEEAPETQKKKSKKKEVPTSLHGQELYRKGYQRLLVNNEVIDLSSAEGQIFTPGKDEAFVIVDRFIVKEDLLKDSRFMDSIEQALLLGNGKIEARSTDGKIQLVASRGYSCSSCGASYLPPTPALFSSNSPLGACDVCSGFGEVLELNEELIVPDRSKALRDGAVDPFSKPSYLDWQKEVLKAMEKIRGVAPYTRYKELKEKDREFLWEGGDGFPGIRGYFEQLKAWRYKLHVRVFIRRFQSLSTCLTCKGSRLAAAPLAFRVGEKNIGEVLQFSILEALSWIQSLNLGDHGERKTKEVIRQIRERLDFLKLVGVGYLRLNRKGNTLSGGEYQRISLASQLGSKLSNTLYVLDEPSIGLHPCDTEKLIQVIHALRDHGNTLVVVEHDTSVMKSADFLVEVGPKAGTEGGSIVASGSQKDFLKIKTSLTAQYLSGNLSLQIPKQRRAPKDKFIELKGCRENNLKNIDVRLPLGCLVAITGASGSGKSTLIRDTLYTALARLVLNEPVPSYEIGKHDSIKGWENLRTVLMLDQAPIGRSSRSNTATYMKIYDDVRKIMSSQAAAARRHLSPSDFSFNVDGGRCPTCKGDGYVEVDMHFMADVRLLCDDCQGKRFKKHVLEVEYRSKNIDQILHTTVKDAMALFADSNAIVSKLQLLDEVGLGYLQLGQSVSSLSGGECQRLKIAATLDEQKGDKGSNLYIFDEPTTGLHIHDVKKLVEVFHRLVDSGNSVFFIEHNMDLVAQADWVVDLGPGGGESGGDLVVEGKPEDIAKKKLGITAPYLAEALRKS
jgi:excinuclease ABC subunit A